MLTLFSTICSFSVQTSQAPSRVKTETNAPDPPDTPDTPKITVKIGGVQNFASQANLESNFQMSPKGSFQKKGTSSSRSKLNSWKSKHQEKVCVLSIQMMLLRVVP